ncbi:hypothetical protein HY504_02340 [Candidatus Wolfebacteria bacterium]|nr:hypothetical protein [Candidatus Wolfebacteria bacterium]
MIYESIEFPIFITALIANCALGIVVWRYAPKNEARYLFCLFVLAQVLWIGVNFAAFRVTGEEFLVFARLTIFFAAIHAFAFFLFIYTFLEEKNVLTKKLLIPFFVVLALVLAVALSPLTFKRVSLESGRVILEQGLGMIAFGFFVAVCVVWAFYVLAKKYRKSQGIERIQWRYLAIGLSLTFLLVLIFSFLNFAFFKNLTTVRFGHLYTLPFIAFTAFAMIRHHLLNIKVIMAELSVVLLNLTLVVEVLTAETLGRLFASVIVLIGTFVIGILLVRGVIREVEQREKLEVLTKELEAANERLQEVDRMKSQFYSFVSHQIKTPIGIIKGFTSLILDGSYGVIPDHAKETIGKMKDAADRLIALVENFLDLRKIESGKMEYSFENVDIVHLARTMVEELKPLATRKNLTLSFHSPAAKIVVKADIQRLSNVFQNLIDNAIKYTEAGWVKVEIGIANRKSQIAKSGEGESVLVTVSDSGRGMSKELLPTLFEQYTRDAKVVKTITGTGLGLYLAKEIVTGHGGEVWAESDGEGKGSRFIVRLPIVS